MSLFGIFFFVNLFAELKVSLWVYIKDKIRKMRFLTFSNNKLKKIKTRI